MNRSNTQGTVVKAKHGAAGFVVEDKDGVVGIGLKLFFAVAIDRSWAGTEGQPPTAAHKQAAACRVALTHGDNGKV